MVERFLFNWVHLRTSHITGRDAKNTSLIEANPANTPLTRVDKAAMRAGRTTHRSIRFRAEKGRFPGHFIKNLKTFHAILTIIIARPHPELDLRKLW
ncbi:hypothetical protein SDC9_101559 [bioreactor metagenome]|uniref:Uncharacterized protein n=1 Tax=bioreactor metagenome TaxID=1076179 RepID=A0A645ANM9_9ZZZZ